MTGRTRVGVIHDDAMHEYVLDPDDVKPGSDPGQGRQQWHTVLILCLSLASVLLWGTVCGLRLSHPVALEVMEEGVAVHSLRVSQGLPLYCEPSLEHVAFVYGPLFHQLGAVALQVFGGHLYALRLLSLAATVFLLVWLFKSGRHRAGTMAGVLTAGWFAACYPAAAAWYDLVRVDMLALAFLMPVVHLTGGGLKGCIFAVLLAVAAFLTKQSTAVLSLAVCLGIGFVSWRRGVLLASAMLLVGALASFVLHLSSEGWSTFFLFELPAQHPLVFAYFHDAVVGQVLLKIPILLGFAVAGAVLLVRQDRCHLALVMFALAALGSAVAQRLRHGGWYNVMIPAHAALSLLAACAVVVLLRRGGATALVTMLAVFLQFVLLFEDPRKFVPDARARANAELVITQIRSVEGEVFAPSHTFSLHLAGKPVHADFTAAWDLDRAPSARAKAVAERLRQDLATAIWSGRFRALLLPDEFVRSLFPTDLPPSMTPAFPPGEHMHTVWPLGFESLWWYRP